MTNINHLTGFRPEIEDLIYSLLVLEEKPDREAVILGAAYLDTVLECAMRSKITGLTNDESRRLFENRGALSAFGDRISVSLAFGIITRRMNDEFGVIKKIRNHYAHAPGDFSLSHPVLSSLCSDLTISQVADEEFRMMSALAADPANPEANSISVPVTGPWRFTLKDKQIILDNNQNKGILIIYSNNKLGFYIPISDNFSPTPKGRFVQSVQVLCMLLMARGLHLYIKNSTPTPSISPDEKGA